MRTTSTVNKVCRKKRSENLVVILVLGATTCCTLPVLCSAWRRFPLELTFAVPACNCAALSPFAAMRFDTYVLTVDRSISSSTSAGWVRVRQVSSASCINISMLPLSQMLRVLCTFFSLGRRTRLHRIEEDVNEMESDLCPVQAVVQFAI